MRGGLRRVLVAVAMLTVAACAPEAGAQGAAAAGGGSTGATPAGIAVVGDGPRTVTLTRRTDSTLQGTMSLLLTNNANRKRRPTIRYFPESAGKPLDLPLGAADPPIALLSDDGQVLTKVPSVPKNGERRYVLRFTVAAGTAPGTIDGRLSISGKLVEVKGKANAFPGVTFEPAKVSMHVVSRRGLLFGSAEDKTEKVELTGAGVPALFAPGTKKPEPDLLLVDGDGHGVRVSLENLTRTAPDSFRATASVKVTGDLEPGAVKGDLSLSDVAPDAPKLEVEVKTKDAFIWPLVAALTGAFASLLLLSLAGRNRRKGVLRDNLRGMLSEYKSARDRYPNLKLWDIEDITKVPEQDWFSTSRSAMPELQGVRGIWSEIAYARNDADLDDSTDQVVALRSRIMRWIEVAESVAPLSEVASKEHLLIGTHDWNATKTHRVTHDMLRHVGHTEPPDDAAANALVVQVEDQARWYDAFASAWDQAVNAYEAVKKAEPTGGPKTTAFNASVADLLALDEESAKPESVGQKVDSLVRGAEDLEKRFREVHIGAEPETAAEQATAERRELAMAASDRSGAATEGGTGSQGPSVPEWGRRNGPDIFRTVAIAGVSAVAYMAPLYNSTWGSFTDYGTAFAAGFLGKIIVDWTASPLFQSLRLRAKQAAADTAATQTAAAATESAAATAQAASALVAGQTVAVPTLPGAAAPAAPPATPQ